MQAFVQDGTVLLSYYSSHTGFQQVLYAIRTFLTLVEIIEFTKSFLCMGLEDYFFWKKMKKLCTSLLICTVR